MRFNFLIAASFLVTLATGLVIPANTFSARDLEAREDLVDSDADIFVRANIFKTVANALKPTYHVPAGPGKPARESERSCYLNAANSRLLLETYSRAEVKQAVRDAKTEAVRIAAPGVSNRSKKNSPLKVSRTNRRKVSFRDLIEI